jgi:hypothetical protein
MCRQELSYALEAVEVVSKTFFAVIHTAFFLATAKSVKSLVRLSIHGKSRDLSKFKSF